MQNQIYSFVLILAILISTLTVQVKAVDYGPDTCLEGWVWRRAVSNDIYALHSQFELKRYQTTARLPKDETEMAVHMEPTHACQSGSGTIRSRTTSFM